MSQDRPPQLLPPGPTEGPATASVPPDGKASGDWRLLSSRQHQGVGLQAAEVLPLLVLLLALGILITARSDLSLAWPTMVRLLMIVWVAWLGATLALLGRYAWRTIAARKADPPAWHACRESVVWSLRGFASLGLCFAIYSCLELLIPLLNPTDRDAWLIEADRVLGAGTQPSLLLEALVHPVLTEVFAFFYATYAAILVAVLVELYLRGKADAFWHTLHGMVLTMLIGFVGYALVPAVGPSSTLAALYSVPLHDNVVTRVVGDYAVSRGTFPSLHAGVPALLTLMARRHHQTLFGPVLVLTLGIWGATLYLRYHYLVDLVAGVALAWLMFQITPSVRTGWHTLMAAAAPEPTVTAGTHKAASGPTRVHDRFN